MILRTKREIADLLGISTATLRRWLKPVMPELEKLGYPSHRILTRPMLEIVYKHLVITDDDFEKASREVRR